MLLSMPHQGQKPGASSPNTTAALPSTIYSAARADALRSCPSAVFPAHPHLCDKPAHDALDGHTRVSTAGSLSHCRHS